MSDSQWYRFHFYLSKTSQISFFISCVETCWIIRGYFIFRLSFEGYRCKSGIPLNKCIVFTLFETWFFDKKDQTRFYLLMFIGTPLFIVKWGLVYCELEVPRRSNIPVYFLLKLRSSRACFKYFRTWNSINT